MEVRETLNERGGRYGRFDKHAGLAEALITTAQFDIHTVAQRPGWLRLAPDQRHAIRYILDKIARVLEGDPNYNDNWHDMAGYATLIEDRLNGTGLYKPTTPIVQASQCSSIGIHGANKCSKCGERVGNAHKPECAYNQDVSHSG